VLVAVLILFVTFSYQEEKVKKKLKKGSLSEIALHNISYAK